MPTLFYGDWVLPVATGLYVAEKSDVAEILQQRLIPSRRWRGQTHTDQCSPQAWPWLDATHILHLSHLLGCRALHHDWLKVMSPACTSGTVSAHTGVKPGL